VADHLIRTRHLGSSAVAGVGDARRAAVDEAVGVQAADTGVELLAARADLALSDFALSTPGVDLAPDRLSRGCGFGSLGPGMSSGLLGSSRLAMDYRWKGAMPFSRVIICARLGVS
jgi:hypothetical protein